MFSERSARRRRRRRRIPRLLRGLAATGAILLAIGAIGYIGSRIRSPAPAETTSTTGAAVTASRRSAPTRRPSGMTLRVQARRVGTLTSAIQDAAAAPASATGRSVALLAGLSASDSRRTRSASPTLTGTGRRDVAVGAARRRCRLRRWSRLSVRWRRRDLPARGDLSRRHDQWRRDHVADLPAASSDQSGTSHRRHGLHRRRLHGQPVARHDRRVSPAELGQGRGAPAERRSATQRSPRSAAT